jgi:hypothetical protein
LTTPYRVSYLTILRGLGSLRSRSPRYEVAKLQGDAPRLLLMRVLKFLHAIERLQAIRSSADSLLHGMRQ